jgi:hypothetical protein
VTRSLSWLVGVALVALGLWAPRWLERMQSDAAGTAPAGLAPDKSDNGEGGPTQRYAALRGLTLAALKKSYGPGSADSRGDARESRGTLRPAAAPPEFGASVTVTVPELPPMPSRSEWLDRRDEALERWERASAFHHAPEAARAVRILKLSPGTHRVAAVAARPNVRQVVATGGNPGPRVAADLPFDLRSAAALFVVDAQDPGGAMPAQGRPALIVHRDGTAALLARALPGEIDPDTTTTLWLHGLAVLDGRPVTGLSEATATPPRALAAVGVTNEGTGTALAWAACQACDERSFAQALAAAGLRIAAFTTSPTIHRRADATRFEWLDTSAQGLPTSKTFDAATPTTAGGLLGEKDTNLIALLRPTSLMERAARPGLNLSEETDGVVLGTAPREGANVQVALVDLGQARLRLVADDFQVLAATVTAQSKPKPETFGNAWLTARDGQRLRCELGTAPQVPDPLAAPNTKVHRWPFGTLYAGGRLLTTPAPNERVLDLLPGFPNIVSLVEGPEAVAGVAALDKGKVLAVGFASVASAAKPAAKPGSVAEAPIATGYRLLVATGPDRLIGLFWRNDAPAAGGEVAYLGTLTESAAAFGFRDALAFPGAATGASCTGGRKPYAKGAGKVTLVVTPTAPWPMLEARAPTITPSPRLQPLR